MERFFYVLFGVVIGMLITIFIYLLHIWDKVK